MRNGRIHTCSFRVHLTIAICYCTARVRHAYIRTLTKCKQASMQPSLGRQHQMPKKAPLLLTEMWQLNETLTTPQRRHTVRLCGWTPMSWFWRYQEVRNHFVNSVLQLMGKTQRSPVSEEGPVRRAFNQHQHMGLFSFFVNGFFLNVPGSGTDLVYYNVATIQSRCGWMRSKGMWAWAGCFCA